MTAHPTVPEGDLSRHRATLVSARSLAEVANILDLGAVLRLGRGEQRSGGRQKESLLADAFEAVVGAIYLDHGLDAVQHFVLAHLGERIDATDVRIDDQDFKTKLQEYSQRAFQKAPTYEVIGESGPDHAKEFHVAVLLNGESFAEGMGHSKKTAERAAAGRALRLIEEGQVLA